MYTTMCVISSECSKRANLMYIHVCIAVRMADFLIYVFTHVCYVAVKCAFLTMSACMFFHSAALAHNNAMHSVGNGI